MTDAAILSAPESAPWPRGVLASYEDVTPPRVDEPRPARSTDASKLTFPLQLVIIILGVAVSVVLATSTLRSDVRDILTRMEAQVRIDSAKAESQRMRDAALHEQINALGAQISAAERRQELLRLEFQQLREQVLFKGKVVK